MRSCCLLLAIALSLLLTKNTCAGPAAQFGKLPLAFERNQGQTDAKVKFLARTPGYTLFLTTGEAVLSAKSGVLRMTLLGANPAPAVSGVDEMPGKANYFLGADAAKWHANVPTYSKVAYKSVYSGIDLVYYGNQSRLEYDFIVAPGADPHRIRFAVRGANQVTRSGEGDLVLSMPDGDIRWHKPFAYQVTNGERQQIAARYVMKSKGDVAFELGRYDTHKPLFIDPLIYSTYLGGTNGATGDGIALDSAGNAYVTGTTYSTNFPTVNPLQPANGGGGNPDAFVSKFNPDGSALLYSTYLGGSGSDYATGIAVDSAGNAYVAGYTTSSNFPTKNPLQTYIGGGSQGYDAFVAKLNPTGSALVYSTYLAGSGDDQAYGIAADSAGNAYVVGTTGSINFPTLKPFQPTLNGFYDAFITKINPTGSAFVYSTYFGGSSSETGYGIAVDSTGNAYITGYTGSLDFPVLNAAQPTAGGAGDAFMAKFDSAGSALIYSTYLGGSSSDYAQGIALDASGDAFVIGYTFSSDFPVVNPFQPSFAGDSQTFVAQLNAAGSALTYSSFLGGSTSLSEFSFADNYGHGIAVDVLGNAYVTGETNAINFPTVNALQPTNGGDYWDAFVAKINPTGSSISYSTYLGGNGVDSGYAIAVDSMGNAYITGWTSSTNFPTLNPLQPTNLGSDAFVTEIAAGPALSPVLLAYGNQTVATASAPQVATLTNIGDVALAITLIYIEGPDNKDFSQTNDCPQSLPVGGSCNISVTFRPTSTGMRTAAIAVSDNATVNRQTVTLGGYGVLPVLSLSPTSLTFNSQSVFTTSGAQNVTLTNTGSGVLSVENIATSGPFSQTNTCGATVNAGASCTISVTFTPKQTGSLTGSLLLGDNVPGSPQSLPLTGVGVSPVVTLVPTSLTFPDQTIFSTSPVQVVTLLNAGTGAAYLTIGSIAATPPFSQTNNCGTTVNAGASCNISVTFKPTTAGVLTGSITIHDNAPGPQIVPLTGTGTDMQFAPASWSFGTQPVSTTSLSKKIALTNKGSATVTVTKVSITGANPADFAQTNTCAAVASGASCFITVTFTPTTTGKRSAQVAVYDNGGGSPQTAALTGSGI